MNSDTLIAGQPGEILLAYHAGPDGMHAGDELRLELPTGWHTRHSCSSVENLAKFQFRNPNKANYFGVLSDESTRRFSYNIAANQRLNGEPNRFKSLLGIQLVEGELAANDSFTILIRGWKEDGHFNVPDAGGSGWIEAEFVSASTSECTTLLEPTRLTVQAGSPMELAVVIPSIGKIGERLTLKMRLLDENFNAVSTWPDEVSFQVSVPMDGIPSEMSVDELNKFGDRPVTLDFRVAAPGTYAVKVIVPGLPPAESNPVVVSDSPPGERLYWGDLHAHTEVSKDGVGEGPLVYARDASLLDFVATTEHNTEQDNPYARNVLLPEGDWDSIRQDVIDYYDPGVFVTLLAFENSAASPSGHQNVYFSTTDAPILLGGQLDETWKAASPYGAFIIQHHPGIIWHAQSLPQVLSRFYALFIEGSWVNWNAFASVPRPALEIYSLHGQGEYFNPLDALSYENSGLGLPRDGDPQDCPTGISKRGPHYARDAWARGLRMGVVAGSDDHRAQPGKTGGGLTAVRADTLTREGIFDAIHDRRTYATTGDRIILDFQINGVPLGSEITAEGDPEITVSVVGTAPLEYLQIMRYELGTGLWEVLFDAGAQPRETTLSVKDTSFSADTIYYVRLQQTNRTHGRPVRAWSSPIWVRRAN